jgi:hypothetical protein
MHVVEHAIVLFHPIAHCYGHLVNEVFPSFLAIPKEIWAKPIFFVPQATLKIVAAELLGLLGKRPLAIRNLWKPVFARRLYVPNPSRFIEIWPEAIRAMRAHVIATLGLGGIVPQNRVIVRRTRNRRIANIDELFDALSAQEPHRHWVVRMHTKRSMLEESCFYANTSLLMFVRGSAGANMAWMPEGSAIVEIQAKFCECFYADVGRALGVKVFEVAFEVHGIHEVVVDIPFMIDVVARAYRFIGPLRMRFGVTRGNCCWCC